MLKRILKRIFKVLLVIILSLVCLTGIFLICRYIRITIVRNNHKITSEKGIDKVEIAEIGGISQYFYIRGQDINNPVILMINGGMPMIPMLHLYQYEWEDSYTIVNWDRRQSGETYYLNKPNSDNLTAAMTDDVLIKDISDAVDYVYEYFGNRKIIILADSMGTTLASRYVMDNPDKISCYIGSAQVTNLREDMRKCAAEMHSMAEADGNEADAINIAELADKLDGSNAYINVYAPLMQYGSSYISGENVFDGIKVYLNGMNSPYFPISHLPYYFISDELKAPLLPYIEDFNLEAYGTDYNVPVTFIIGENDCITRYTIEDYFIKMNAPDKHLYYVPDAGHDTIQQNPDEFYRLMKQALGEMGV